MVLSPPRERPSASYPQHRFDKQTIVFGGDGAIVVLPRQHRLNALELVVAKTQPWHHYRSISGLVQ